MRRDICTPAGGTSTTRSVRSSTTCSPDTKPEEMLMRRLRGGDRQELGQASPSSMSTAMSSAPARCPSCSSTATPTRLDQSVAACVKAFATHDGAALRGELQPAERVARHRARQRRPQPPPPRAAQHQLRRPRFLFAPHAASARARISAAGLPGGVRDRTPDARITGISTTATSATRWCWAPRAAGSRSS